jgi:multiple sugar transport system permease protein
LTVPPDGRCRAVQHLRLDWSTTLVYVALTVGAAIMLYPFIYMISTSLKSPAQVYVFPPGWIPTPIVWSNYVRRLDASASGRF